MGRLNIRGSGLWACPTASEERDSLGGEDWRADATVLRRGAGSRDRTAGFRRDRP